MAGISSNSLNFGKENKRKYVGNELQSKEFSDGSGLDFYDFNARSYDQQIGRFLQVDPFFEDGQESINPYHYSFNNPIRYSDADGKAPDDIVITGANNSSVTIKTDLIDIKVNASSLGIDFGGNYAIGGDEVLGAALDVVGIFDPTGIADGANAALSASKGNWGDAIISGLGVIPYVGDLAKVGKIEKDVKIISNAVDAVKADSKVAKVETKLNSPGGPKTGSAGGPGAGKPFSKSVKNEAKTQANGKCVLCGDKTDTGPRGKKGNTDHAIPKSKGGNNTIDNAQHTCANCNQVEKRTMTTEEFLKKKRRN